MSEAPVRDDGGHPQLTLLLLRVSCKLPPDINGISSKVPPAGAC
jgi:hypothetical protein